MSDPSRDEREPDAERASLHRDVLAGFEQLARGEGREHDAVSIRELIDEIKMRGRGPGISSGGMESRISRSVTSHADINRVRLEALGLR